MEDCRIWIDLYVAIVPFFINYSAKVGSMFNIVHNYTQVVVILVTIGKNL